MNPAWAIDEYANNRTMLLCRSADRLATVIDKDATVELITTGPGDVRAETVNGRLSNDFGIEVKKGRYVGASMNGTIGGGGPRIDLETVNGSIHISSS